MITIVIEMVTDEVTCQYMYITFAIAVFELLSVADQVILQDNNLVTILHIMKGNNVVSSFILLGEG